MIMVAAMACLVVVAGIGLVVDGRELLHESIWAKPFKFGVSFVLYGATLAWMLPKLRRARRTMWTLGTVFAVTGLVDVGFIAIQAARGTYSHFNANPDTFNQIGQQIFSSGVIGLFGASLVIAIMLLFQRVGERALTWSLRAGIGLAVIGMGVAFFIAGSSEGGEHQQREHEDLDGVQADEVRDAQVAALGAPVRDGHAAAVGHADPVLPRQGDRAAVGVLDGPRPLAARPDDEERHGHPDGGQPDPGAQRPGEGPLADPLEQQEGGDHHARHEEPDHTGREDLLADLVERVGVAVEVAVGAARGLDRDEPDVDDPGDGEDRAHRPHRAPRLAQLRQHPRERRAVERERHPELERLRPDRLVQELAGVDDEADARHDDEAGHGGHHDHEWPVP
jgi:hypothetical protein